jgi:hypothetical protein
VWLEPNIQLNVAGVVTGLLSTITYPEPVGLEVIVMLTTTVKIALAVLVPSLAWTVLLAEAETGTTNVAVNEPEASVVIVAGVVVCTTLLYVNETVEDGGKPPPVTVTVEPTYPLDGVRVIP